MCYGISHDLQTTFESNWSMNLYMGSYHAFLKERYLLLTDNIWSNFIFWNLHFPFYEAHSRQRIRGIDRLNDFPRLTWYIGLKMRLEFLSILGYSKTGHCLPDVWVQFRATLLYVYIWSLDVGRKLLRLWHWTMITCLNWLQWSGQW